jgi:7-carboxy-7-deazaguanine synthase
MSTVQLCETFESIQGESSYQGLTCFFIRLAGCNLHCHYCDTPQCFVAGDKTQISTLITTAAASPSQLIEVTGGEPLMQRGFTQLAEGLAALPNKRVLVETNGTYDLSVVPETVTAIVDVKGPSSGHVDSFNVDNIARLRPHDEVKFVIGDRTDYDYAVDFMNRHHLASRCRYVLFSPTHRVLTHSTIAGWIIQDHLPVRLQVQLHKLADIQ